MSSLALELRNVSKKFKTLDALTDVSLEIKEGEIFALLGPNGAGKTTLIGAICGLVNKTSGVIRVFGKDIESDPLAARRSIGLVPQEINFDPFFTVAESLELQMGYFGVETDLKHIDALLDALHLTDKKNANPRSLSGGMKRRLLIAKALVHKPKLLFLDEPTAGVDIELRKDLWAYVEKLRKEGTTVLLTTHYVEEAEALADRIGMIQAGRVVLVEEKKSLMRRLGVRRLTVTLNEGAQLPENVASFFAKGEENHFQYVESPSTLPIPEVLARIYASGAKVLDISTTHSKLEDILLDVMHSKASGVNA